MTRWVGVWSKHRSGTSFVDPIHDVTIEADNLDEALARLTGVALRVTDATMFELRSEDDWPGRWPSSDR